jgi:adenylosuccinate lyase
LRTAGIEQAYEQLKGLTRGKTITPSEYASWVENLSVEEAVKVKLRALSPFTYLGLAEELVARALTADT